MLLLEFVKICQVGLDFTLATNIGFKNLQNTCRFQGIEVEREKIVNRHKQEDLKYYGPKNRINVMLSKGENTVFGIRRPRTSGIGHVNRCAFDQLLNEFINMMDKTAVKIIKMGTDARPGNGHALLE